MERPSRFEFNIGTRGGVAAAACLTMLALYLWATQEQRHEAIPWVVPLVPVLLWKASIAAKQKVDNYNRWTGAWEEMSGLAPQREAQRKAARAKRRRTLGALVLIALWCLCADWLAEHPRASGTPLYTGFAGGFALTSAWAASVVLLPPLRWLARRLPVGRESRGARRWSVALCLRIPRQSPAPWQIKAALPDYCRALLDRQVEEPRV